jgi:predicted RNA binding protein YcfA (HicA-like mRNA interferase family)
MAKRDKLKEKLLSGDHDTNFDFDQLCTVLLHLGFTERKKAKGSHRIFHREGVEEIINLQPTCGNKAKPYQVRQLRGIVTAYAL